MQAVEQIIEKGLSANATPLLSINKEIRPNIFFKFGVAKNSPTQSMIIEHRIQCDMPNFKTHFAQFYAFIAYSYFRDCCLVRKPNIYNGGHCLV